MSPSDLTELATSLLEGAFETPPWTSFLERLRTLAYADYVILIFKPPGWRHDEAMHLHAGEVSLDASKDMYRRYFHPVDPVRQASIAEGRPYSLVELQRLDSGDHADFYDELIHVRGIAGLREMRVEEASGVNAWLTVVRHSSDFSPEIDDLLTTIAPILRGVLRHYVAREQQRHEFELSESANRGLQVGWLTLDAAARIISADTLAEELLASSGAIGRSGSGKLTVTPGAIAREVMAAIDRLANDPQSQPYALSLRRDPSLDVLLVPANNKFVTATGAPTVIAYIHGDNWHTVDRRRELQNMFALTAKEAALALELCRGRKISEAADSAGLTVETARTYSKTIYEKTGARGHADLVRIVMGSILALTMPE